MTIKKGKSYLAIIDNQLTQIRVEDITPASNYKVEVERNSQVECLPAGQGAKRFIWFTFWEIYKIVVEELTLPRLNTSNT